MFAAYTAKLRYQDISTPQRILQGSFLICDCIPAALGVISFLGVFGQFSLIAKTSQIARLSALGSGIGLTTFVLSFDFAIMTRNAQIENCAIMEKDIDGDNYHSKILYSKSYHALYPTRNLLVNEKGKKLITGKNENNQQTCSIVVEEQKPVGFIGNDNTFVSFHSEANKLDPNFAPSIYLEEGEVFIRYLGKERTIVVLSLGNDGNLIQTQTKGAYKPYS